MYVILMYIVVEYVSMFVNAVYTSIMCQVIGPCIFTDYTLAVGYLIFLGLLLSCDYMLI